MKLAKLLRAGNSNNHEREGKVLVLIGEHAFEVFLFCTSHYLN